MVLTLAEHSGWKRKVGRIIILLLQSLTGPEETGTIWTAPGLGSPSGHATRKQMKNATPYVNECKYFYKGKPWKKEPVKFHLVLQQLNSTGCRSASSLRAGYCFESKPGTLSRQAGRQAGGAFLHLSLESQKAETTKNGCSLLNRDNQNAACKLPVYSVEPTKGSGNGLVGATEPSPQPKLGGAWHSCTLSFCSWQKRN